ncbi:hypothetical protein CDD83_5841 [Cordyceps sp. RAO-2017]|nr:hypothetical protein CDD83_5841 [Cordyceps sp. RAO-2017]
MVRRWSVFAALARLETSREAQKPSSVPGRRLAVDLSRPSPLSRSDQGLAHHVELGRGERCPVGVGAEGKGASLRTESGTGIETDRMETTKKEKDHRGTRSRIRLLVERARFPKSGLGHKHQPAFTICDSPARRPRHLPRQPREEIAAAEARHASVSVIFLHRGRPEPRGPTTRGPDDELRSRRRLQTTTTRRRTSEQGGHWREKKAERGSGRPSNLPNTRGGTSRGRQGQALLRPQDRGHGDGPGRGERPDMV